jgi:biopolymer transport protein ExbD
MALLTKRSRLSETIPTSSMADIAFLLLIFFLVTTVFPKDRGLALVIPPTDEPVEVDPDNLLRLSVGVDGFVDITQGRSQQSFRVRAERLGDIWRQRVAERPGLIAAIHTSPDAPYGAMVDVLDALRSAGARRISLKMGGS